MEETIRKIIEADIEAQAKIRQAEEAMKKNLQAVNLEKSKIQDEVWEKAKLYVEEQKEKLIAQLKEAQEAGQAQYQKSLIALEDRFQQSRDQWRQEIYGRCITSR